MIHRDTPGWVQDMFRRLERLQQGQDKILGEMMSFVQVDQSVLDDAAAKVEALVQAVTAFLAHPAVASLPDAVTTGLSQALTDAGSAQAAVVAATPAAPPAPPAS